MTNGTYEIASTGTAADFYTVLREALNLYTGWEVSDEGDLGFTVATNLEGVSLTFADTAGSSSTTKSNSVTVTCNLTSATGKLATTTTLPYQSSNTTVNTEANRKLYLHVFQNDNITYVELTNYAKSTPLFGTTGTTSTTYYLGVGVLKASNVQNGMIADTYLVGGAFYDPTDFSTTSRAILQPISVAANGVVMLNYPLTKSGTITDRLDHVYNCSTLTTGFNYSINGKKYLAFNANTLFEQ